jgi:hypothetical protein
MKGSSSNSREDGLLAARPAGMPSQAAIQLSLSQARKADAKRYAQVRQEARGLRSRIAALPRRAR